MIQKSYDIWERAIVANTPIKYHLLLSLEALVAGMARIICSNKDLEEYNLSPKILKLADRLELTVYEGDQ